MHRLVDVYKLLWAQRSRRAREVHIASEQGHGPIIAAEDPIQQIDNLQIGKTHVWQWMDRRMR